jgi:hypothetical protein
MTAVVALIPMTAQGSGSADLDGAHDPQMMAGQAVGLSISRAVLTEDFRHLQAVGGSQPLSGLGNWGGLIERRGDLGQIQPAHMQIDSGRDRGSMAQQQLDMVEARSGFNQVRGKAVPQGMHASRFGDAGPFFGLVEELLYRIGGEVIIGSHPLEQPLLGTIFSPVLP